MNYIRLSVISVINYVLFDLRNLRLTKVERGSRRGAILLLVWGPGAWPWIVLNFLIFILQKQKKRLIKSFIGYEGDFPKEQQPVTWSFFLKTARKWKKLGTEEIRSRLNPSMHVNSLKIRSNNIITTKGIDDCRNTFSKFTIVKIAENIDICFTPNLTYLSINSRKNNLHFINQQIGISQNHFDRNFYLTYLLLALQDIPFYRQNLWS